MLHILTAATHDHTHYLILEYVAGGSLQEYLEKHSLSIPASSKSLSTWLTLSPALTGSTFVHRDLKPANVLLATDGTPA